VNTVYREKQAFGPFGQAAGEVSPDSGYSQALWLEVAQSAPEKFRGLYIICDGAIRIAGVEKGFPDDVPDSPLVVELTPSPRVMNELDRLCHTAQIETPRRILYHGVDPNSLKQSLAQYFASLAAASGVLRVIDEQGNVVEVEEVATGALQDGFLKGELEIYLREAGLGPGLPLGNVSNKNLSAGHFAFGIEVRTTPPIVPSLTDPLPRENYLDPIVLFQALASSKLSDGTEAITPAQKANSWMGVARKNRVLITFRNEWNAALNSGENAIVEGPGAGQVVVKLLNDQQVGTVVAPDGWGQYTCQVSVPSSRRLSRIPSEEGASDTLTITATAPAHTVIGSIRPEDWFSPTDPPVAEGSEPLALPLFTNNNIVTPLIDGFEAFAHLAKDLKPLDDSSTPGGPHLPGGFLPPDHFVLLVDWWMDVEFALIPDQKDSTVRDLLRKAVLSKHSVIVRALAWAGGGDIGVVVNNTAPILALDTMDAGTPSPDLTSAFLDDLGSILRALHSKMSVVRNRYGTFVQLGGIDLNPNRLDGPEHKPDGRRYHDVHCRIQGPAVADVTEAFLQHYDQKGLGDPITDSIRPTIDTPADIPATQMVQIARTSQRGIYSWVPEGDRTIWATLKKAIRHAKRYIYIEDQYMVAPMLRDELLSALSIPDLEIILVITQACNLGEGNPLAFPMSALDQCSRARAIFFKSLIDHPRVQVFEIGAYYVHAKVVIIDDVFAAIGSANINRRSLTLDSEIHAFVLDGRVEEGTRKFARDLRTHLWAEHLGMRLTQLSFRALNPVERAIELMRKSQPRASRLIPYHLQNLGDDYPPGWDIVDPDGSGG